MHSRFHCNSISDFSDNQHEQDTNDSQHRVASSASSSSLSSARYSEIWNCLWTPLLISLSKEMNSAKAQSILLPGEVGLGCPRLSSSPTSDAALYFRPVIGILSHPGDGASGRLNNATNASYIAASYVKFVESAGARVIPLIYNEPAEILAEKLSLVNGVLFTGGRTKRGLYYEIVERNFKHVLEKNDSGDHFPLFAICLGFELLSMIISKISARIVKKVDNRLPCHATPSVWCVTRKVPRESFTIQFFQDFDNKQR